MIDQSPSTFRSKSCGSGLWLSWIMSFLLCTAADPDRYCDDKSDGSFDFFYFVQQWPGAFCSRGCCFAPELPMPAVRFGIHGLWPARIQELSPCYCPSHMSSKKEWIWPELERMLQMQWIAMRCPNYPDMLYAHEWKKHGTCSGMDQVTYFTTSLNLHIQYNILDALSYAGIYPNGQFYNLEYVRWALTNVFGADPVVTCSFNDQYQVSQIYEVYICLNKEELLPFPCPANPHLQKTCRHGAALFPVFDPRFAISVPLSPPASPFPSPIRLCTHPYPRNEFALEFSDDEGDRGDGIYDVDDAESQKLCAGNRDTELVVDHDELQSFLGNRSDEIDVDRNIPEQEQW